jgi:CRISPR-associated protein Cmr2
MNKYIGITIGPIIKTLYMARKPRELWSASYMFSELMNRLITQIPEDVIFSSVVVKTNTNGIGLYSDRLFCKNFKGNIKDIIDNVRVEYSTEIGVYADYFKIYAVEIEVENDSDAIGILNKQLDCLELHNIAISDVAEKSVRDLIAKKDHSPLFNAAFGNGHFELKYETLAEIASAQLEQLDGERYKGTLKEAKKEENETGKDALIKSLKEAFPKRFQTPHKYICIVHADGDNVGSIINQLTDKELKHFSEKMMAYSLKSCQSIKKFQGFPIYAGGDDLLFIAPVVSNDKDGNTQTIFDLIKQIDEDFKNAKVPEITVTDKEGVTLTPSISYGISITYYKYPLYEALEMSRNLLFDVAKKTKGKNAIAWTLQKGSGSSMDSVFSKNNTDIYAAFGSLIKTINVNTDKNLISAVAHKIKASESLLKLFMGTKKQLVRLDAFFDKTLEYDDKKEDEKKYLDAVKELLIAVHSITNSIKKTIEITYAMLRTVKFIKGLEDDKDE